MVNFYGRFNAPPVLIELTLEVTLGGVLEILNDGCEE